MTDGEATPAAERAAPKRAPEVVVARRSAIVAVLLSLKMFNEWNIEILYSFRGLICR